MPAALLGRLSATWVGVIDVTKVEGRFCCSDSAAPVDSGRLSERAEMSADVVTRGALASGAIVAVPTFVNGARADGMEVDTPVLVKGASAGGSEVVPGGGGEIEVVEVERSEVVIAFAVVSCTAVV